MSTCFVARAIALTAIGLASISLHAAERRVITHEDVWLSPRVGAPAVSPDAVSSLPTNVCLRALRRADE